MLSSLTWAKNCKFIFWWVRLVLVEGTRAKMEFTGPNRRDSPELSVPRQACLIVTNFFIDFSFFLAIVVPAHFACMSHLGVKCRWV